MPELIDIVAYCNDRLAPEGFSDYCPNGLQVEAGGEVRRLASGVTANQALIDAAAKQGADALLVHHGYFWSGEAAPLVGMKGRRIRSLFDNGISLLAYHLPLDAHPELGNNVCLGTQLGIDQVSVVEGEQGLLWQGVLTEPLSAEAFAGRIADRLARTPTTVPGGDHKIQTIAWCTGGAQKFIDRAADLGVDAYLSGEISESTVHTARERGIHFYSAGHHATERYGVQALGEALARHFDIEHRFIDIDSPA